MTIARTSEPLYLTSFKFCNLFKPIEFTYSALKNVSQRILGRKFKMFLFQESSHLWVEPLNVHCSD